MVRPRAHAPAHDVPRRRTGMMANRASRVGAGLLLLGWLAPAAASAANLGAVVVVREDRARHRRAHGRGGIRGRGLVAAGHPRARHAAGFDAERRLCARLRHAARRRAVQRRGLRCRRLAEDIGRHGRGGAAARPSRHVQGCGRQRHQRGPARQGARHDARSATRSPCTSACRATSASSAWASSSAISTGAGRCSRSRTRTTTGTTIPRFRCT